MRVVADGHGDILNLEGVVLHTFVRWQRDDQGRIGVFEHPKQGPQHVYLGGTVSVKTRSASCKHPVCYGKASRQGLAALWASQEAARV